MHLLANEDFDPSLLMNYDARQKIRGYKEEIRENTEKRLKEQKAKKSQQKGTGRKKIALIGKHMLGKKVRAIKWETMWR
jgi:hypothetical protein